jgi:hypothetical protein
MRKTSFLNQPAFKRALENGLAQTRGALERTLYFCFGLRDVGEFGLDLGDDFNLFRQWRQGNQNLLNKTKIQIRLNSACRISPQVLVLLKRNSFKYSLHSAETPCV